MRRASKSHNSNQDRWLVSYADFITLLFALFVVMFASSRADRGKARIVSEAVMNAFGRSSAEIDKSSRENSDPGALPSLQPLLGTLVQDLQPEILAGKMRVRMEERGLVVSLNQATFFPSGEDAIDPKTLDSIAKLARAIRTVPNPVRLEGHTDSIPIHTARFNSNWDLSSARAISVINLLEERWGVTPGRLAATGYADTIPVDSNETEQGRARNRRVDVVILNAVATGREPEGRRY